MFTAAAIVLSIETGDKEPTLFVTPAIVLTVILWKKMSVNRVVSMYEKAIRQNNYKEAKTVLNKNIAKHNWLAVLKLNLYLVNGEIELYEYHYNNFTLNLNKKQFRYYKYLLHAYKLYYDLLCNNGLELTEIKNIQNITPVFPTKICCESIMLLNSNKPEQALRHIKQLVLNESNAFLQYIYAYIQYLCAQKLGYNLDSYKRVLKKLAYNEFLKEHLKANILQQNKANEDKVQEDENPNKLKRNKKKIKQCVIAIDKTPMTHGRRKRPPLSLFAACY